MSDLGRCRCGCEGPAISIVETLDFRDPPGATPAPEPVCWNALSYLRDAAAELDLPFRIVAGKGAKP